MPSRQQRQSEGSGGVSRPLILSPALRGEGSRGYLRKTLLIGTRGSPLALVQTSDFVRRLRLRYPNIRAKVVVIKTSGDKGRKNFNKGLFVKEIEEALLAGLIDAAVHSLKDVPAHLPKGLQLTAFLKRSDPGDILISCRYKSLKAMPKGARLGTSSPRRAAQALAANPGIKIVPLRGNVGTRLKKLEEGECDATIIAAAAIERLGLQPFIVRAKHALSNVEGSRTTSKVASRLVSSEGETRSKNIYACRLANFVPAIGQGIVCIETRSNDPRLNDIIRAGVNDKKAEAAAVSERAFLQAVGGDCHTPVAAHATIKSGRIYLTGQALSPNGKKMMTHSFSGIEAAVIGKGLGNYFFSRGAREMIGLVRQRPVLWTGLSVDERYLRDPRIIHLPMIEIRPPSDGYRSLDRAVRGLDRYDWVVFTSKNGVEAFVCHSESARGGRRIQRSAVEPTRSFAIAQDDHLPKIAAVGRATAGKLREYGFNVTLQPKRDESSRGLAKAFRKFNVKGKRVLFPRAKEGLDTLATELKKMGARVDIVEAYRTVRAKIDVAAWKRYFTKNPPSKIFFSSPSGVRAFFEHFGR